MPELMVHEAKSISYQPRGLNELLDIAAYTRAEHILLEQNRVAGLPDDKRRLAVERAESFNAHFNMSIGGEGHFSGLLDASVRAKLIKKQEGVDLILIAAGVKQNADSKRYAKFNLLEEEVIRRAGLLIASK